MEQENHGQQPTCHFMKINKQICINFSDLNVSLTLSLKLFFRYSNLHSWHQALKSPINYYVNTHMISTIYVSDLFCRQEFSDSFDSCCCVLWFNVHNAWCCLTSVASWHELHGLLFHRSDDFCITKQYHSFWSESRIQNEMLFISVL